MFDAIPRAEALFVWDATEQTWRYASRSARAPSGGLDLLKPGMGVWLRLGGSGAVRWERRVVVPARPRPPYRSLGYAQTSMSPAHFVAWTYWSESVDAFDAFGDDLLVAQRWDSVAPALGRTPYVASVEPEFAQAVISNVRAGDDALLDLRQSRSRPVAARSRQRAGGPIRI